MIRGFPTPEWLPHMKSTSHVQATNGSLADSPVIDPDPHAVYASDSLNIKVLPAPRTHRCGTSPTEQKFLNVATVADDKQLGRFGDFTDHLSSGRTRLKDTLLDMAKARGNYFPVQRVFPCLTFPVRTPTTPAEKILSCQCEVISEVLEIPVSDTINYFACENNSHRTEPACDNTPFDCADINETVQQMAVLLDIDPETVRPDSPPVQAYMEQSSAEEKAAFQNHCANLDCSDVTDVMFEILIASKNGTTPTAFDLQPDEIPVTKDYIKIDSTKIRDLRNVPENERSRCVAATTAEIQQLVDLGVFAFVRAEKVSGAKPTESQIIRRVKYDSLGNYLKDEASLVMKGFQSKLGAGHFGVFSPWRHSWHAFGRAKINALIFAELPPGISFEKDGISSKTLIGCYTSSTYWVSHVRRMTLVCMAVPGQLASARMSRSALSSLLRQILMTWRSYRLMILYT
mmetsp:Transcript_10158/g.30755  ORF Transcript_10158/g.30755 Transcript_10158/m.30755 type:complete len:458 (+) Transcript_10158:591-1964(+)